MSRSPRRDAQTLIVEDMRAADQRIRRAAVAAAKIDRTAPGVAPIEPRELDRLFRADTATAWQRLAGLTSAQLINQAIEYTTDVLEPAGRNVTWGDVLSAWQRKLAAKRAA